MLSGDLERWVFLLFFFLNALLLGCFLLIHLCFYPRSVLSSSTSPLLQIMCRLDQEHATTSLQDMILRSPYIGGIQNIDPRPAEFGREANIRQSGGGDGRNVFKKKKNSMKMSINELFSLHTTDGKHKRLTHWECAWCVRWRWYFFQNGKQKLSN